MAERVTILPGEEGGAIFEDSQAQRALPGDGVISEDVPPDAEDGNEGVGTVAAKYRTYGWLGRLRR